MPNVGQHSLFDVIANAYDTQFTDSATGRLQRQRVWHFAQRWFSTQQHNRVGDMPPCALEINCGTGTDALWLAEQGFKVLATDASPQMVAVAKQKIEASNKTQQVRALVCDITALIKHPEANAFSQTGGWQLTFSNFGGLNCLDPTSLQRFGSDLSTLMPSGALFLAVAMGRFCAWETLYFTLKGRMRQAFRRVAKGSVSAPLGNGNYVDTWYYAPRELAAYFPGFRIRAVYPIGFWLPPSYLDPFFERRPKLLKILQSLERGFNHKVWALASDHYCIVLERKA